MNTERFGFYSVKLRLIRVNSRKTIFDNLALSVLLLTVLQIFAKMRSTKALSFYNQIRLPARETPNNLLLQEIISQINLN